MFEMDSFDGEWCGNVLICRVVAVERPIRLGHNSGA